MDEILAMVRGWRVRYEEALRPLYAELTARYGENWLDHIEEARAEAERLANEGLRVSNG